MDRTILLGFEIGSGREVKMILAHTVITGMSQLSGKTTALTAIIDRSKLRAIAFITKRGESGFQNYHEIPPFFIEKSDWQYVASILEAYLREKMKFERSWIMKATKGAESLKEVLINFQRLRKKARTDSLTESVYMTLEEYLGKIIPQIERFTFTKTLNLENGINVMNLGEMTLEMRSLVIRSVMEYVNEKMKNVVVVIPEAWELLPQGRTTPVKLFAEVFIRKGASIGNYLFIDSQDIAGIDKTPLRQCNNWIMGRQRETHEIERLRSVIGKKVSEDEIRSLKLGHFIAAIGDDLKRVYVLPIGVPPEMGRKVALELLAPERVKEYIQDQGKGDEEVYREKLLESEREKDELRKQLDELKAAPKVSPDNELKMKADIAIAEQRGVEAGKAAFQPQLEEAEKRAREAEATVDELEGQIETFEQVANRMESLRLTATSFLKPIIVEIVKEQGLVQTIAPAPQNGGLDLRLSVKKSNIEIVHTIKRLEVTTNDLIGKIAYLYYRGEFGSEWFSQGNVYKLFNTHGWNKNPKTQEALRDFANWGFFELRSAGRRPEYRVILPIEEAKAKGLIKFTEKIE